MFVRTTPTEPIEVLTDDGCRLQLQRHPGGSGAKPVLLVHGASAASDTFLIGEHQTLVDYLHDAGFDVWALDWRASKRRVKDIYCELVAGDRNARFFTVDAAAKYDVPAAIKTIKRLGVTRKIGIVAHCLGGGIVAEGISVGAISSENVDNVILSGLGLFYRASIDDRLKAEDQALEQLLAKGEYLLHPTERWSKGVCTRAPGEGKWDPLLEVAFDVWSDTPLRHDCKRRICHRVSYMFGMPYLPTNIPTIHDDHHELENQFGYIPMQFLLHCAQNLRRGHCGPFAPDLGERTPPSNLDELRGDRFADHNTTLITGNLNCLWHRDSIDTMYEWLLRSVPSNRAQKHVLDGFGHQDLYWGINAPGVVFPLIKESLEAGL